MRSFESCRAIARSPDGGVRNHACVGLDLLPRYSSFFAVQQEGSDGASQAGENQEGYECHDKTKDHNESEAFRGVEQLKELLYVRVRALGGVLLNVVEKGIMDFFSGSESCPQCKNRGDNTESQDSSKCTQPRSHASRDMSGRTAPAVEHHRQKPGCKHAQPGRLADDDDKHRYH
jgi:hypothetical protein